MRDAPFNKARAMELLRERGAHGAFVSFSGGNDSGDVDTCVIYVEDGDDEGVTVNRTVNRTYDGGHVYSAEAGRWVKQYREVTAEQAADNELYDQLTALMWERYGSFAGEYYVNGTIEFDVAKDAVQFNHDEQVYESNFTEESF